ncbi:MAG: ABC-type transport auxiliary lipoprotein family protein, partial [Burkholderiaceae bacterium]
PTHPATYPTLQPQARALPAAPQNTMNSIAANALLTGAMNGFYGKTRASMLLASVALLCACATPQAPLAKTVYDFGPVLTVPSSAAASGPAISLGSVEANAALEGTQVLYRLAYADAQQLRPYAQARWSMPPAQLLRLRLRDALGARGAVLGTVDAAGWVLKVELDEFSHLFDSPSSSSAVVRLQASLLQGDKLVAQRSLLARASAPSQDAPGGVRALTAATDDAVAQLSSWVAQQVK